MLDRVLVHRDALFATVVLEAAKPVAAARELVEVAFDEFALELVVADEAAI